MNQPPRYQILSSEECDLTTGDCEETSRECLLQIDPRDAPVAVEKSFARPNVEEEEVPPLLEAWQFKGWRVGGSIAAGATFIALILNIAAAVYVAHKATFGNGLGILFRADCSRVNKVNTGLHLLINILSTVILGGTNYCMQCLVAPTRSMLDREHRRGRWMDIGSPSLLNVNKVTNISRALWLTLLLTSLPLHLMYNSAVYASLTTHDYVIRIANTQYIDRLLSGNITAEEAWAKDIAQWKREENADCIKSYAVDVNSANMNLVIASTSQLDTDTILYQTTYESKYAFTTLNSTYEPYTWICIEEDLKYLPYGDPRTECDVLVPSIIKRADEWAPRGHRADYCLSQPSQTPCTLNVNRSIIITVIVCNFIKCLVMIFVVFARRETPLLVLGDAMDSFLRLPDASTRGLGLLSKADVVATTDTHRTLNQSWKRKDTRLCDPMTPFQSRFRAVRKRYWIITIFLCCLAIGAALGVMIWGVTQLFSGNAISSLWKLKIGSVNGRTLISGAEWLPDKLSSYTARILSAVLIANMPQFILSMLYFSLNSIMTNMCLAMEWANFSQTRKTLRVSQPKGEQRCSFFLTVPYRYGIPMLLVSAMLHWLVSQSIYVAVVAIYDANDEVQNPLAVATCGFSPLGTLLTAISGILLIIAVVTFGSFKLKTHMPLVGSCSIAISAACHPLPEEKDITLKPLMWGVVPMIDRWNNLHCTFSSQPVEPLTSGTYT